MTEKRGIAAIVLLLAGFALWVIAAPIAAAQDAPAQLPEDTASQADVPEDEEELQRLLDILDKHTEIATKSKLNTDFVPGMVTVLDGEDLRSRGVQTVWEALNLVPGIETAIDLTGQVEVVARGIGKSSVTGNIKYQLNGIDMNAGHFGEAYSLLYMPIVQIERIEVIVGPGSAIHGEYAYAGVINLITKKGGNQLAGSVGSYDSYLGAARLSYREPKNEFSLDVNLALSQTDGADTDSGEDLPYNLGMPDISNAPGPVNEAQKMKSGILDLAFKGFSLSGYYRENGLGGHFGIVGALPPPSDKIVYLHKNYGVQARQQLNLVPDLKTVIKLGYLNHQYTPSDPIFVFPAGYLGIYPDGGYSKPYYREARIDGGIDFTWDGFRHHTIKLGYSFAQTRVEDVWHEVNFVPSTGAPLDSITRFTGEENWLEEDIERLRNSVTLQDEIAVGPAVNITAGLRFDHWDDVGSDLSPRLAVVWRATDHHIFKTQYAHAFRPPTLDQLYALNAPVRSNKDISSETIDTIELGYIYRSTRRVGRVTLFYSNLKDFIITDPVNAIYVNSEESFTLMGVEGSLEQRLGDSLKLDATLSYVDTSDADIGASAVVANWLGNIGALYEVNPDLLFNLQGRYVGERQRAPQDPRDDLDDYFAVDATGTVYNLLISKLTLRAGVKNIFDADVRDPSSGVVGLSETFIATYIEDLPRPGRTWWTSLSYDF